MLKVDFNTTREDLVDYYLNIVNKGYFLRWGPVISVQLLFWCIAVIAAIVSSKGWILAEILGPMAIWYLIAIAVWGIHPVQKTARSWARLLADRAIKGDICAMLVGPKEVIIGEKDLEIHAGRATIAVPLQHLKAKLIGRSIVIQLLSTFPILIPERAFVSDQQRQGILQQLETKGTYVKEERDE
jgi:hypothetical protein